MVVLIVATAFVGNRDKSGETVPAGEWAQSVCGAVGVWRGEIEAIVRGRSAPARAIGGHGTEEPQSQTPQGRTRLVRARARARRAGDRRRWSTGIDNAGMPDTPQGEDAAKQVSDWADAPARDLEDAQDSLDEEADTLEEALEQLTRARRMRSAAALDERCQDDRRRRRARSRSSRPRSVTRARANSFARRSSRHEHD